VTLVRRIRKKLQKKPSRRKKPSQKRIVMPEAETRSHSFSDPNSTLSPKSVFAYEGSEDFLPEDSTKAPEVGEKPEEESYTQTYPALIDKYISRTGNIPFIFIIGGAVAVISYVLIQDNAAGKLTTFEEVIWGIGKSAIILGFFLVLLVVAFLFRKLFR